MMPEEILCLKCKRLPHPPYSLNLAIADFSLWFLETKPQGIDVSDHEELKGEILAIFPGIPLDELKKSFDHWIERCQRVAVNAGNDYLSSPYNPIFF
jgi:hypothetical protein